MTNYATVNGIIYNDGAYDIVTNPNGLANGGNVVNWVPMISNTMIELSYLKAPGAFSTTSLTIGTGSKTLNFASAVTLTAGLYLLYRASELANPLNYVFGTLAATVNAGTSATFTVAAGGAIGAGSYTDIVVVPAPVKRRPINAQTGVSYTLASTDFGVLITFNNAAATVFTLPTIASMGIGFSFGMKNKGAGAVAVTPNAADAFDTGAVGVVASLTTGQSAEVEADAANSWSVLAAKGYGVPASSGSALIEYLLYGGR